MGRRRLVYGVALGVAVIVALAAAGIGLNAARERARQLEFRVPPGTVARIERGDAVEIFPREVVISLARYDTLVIRNDDTRPITVGPYAISPGQRFIQRYYSPGTYDLICSLHGDTGLRIVVTE